MVCAVVWVGFWSWLPLAGPNPNPGCLGSLQSSICSFMNIMRARSPPKVLLGLKLPSPLVVSDQGVRFLKSGTSRLSREEKLLVVDPPRESTYWATSSQELVSMESSWLNLLHSTKAGSVFLTTGRKTRSTKDRKTAMSFLSMQYKDNQTSRHKMLSDHGWAGCEGGLQISRYEATLALLFLSQLLGITPIWLSSQNSRQLILDLLAAFSSQLLQQGFHLSSSA